MRVQHVLAPFDGDQPVSPASIQRAVVELCMRPEGTCRKMHCVRWPLSAQAHQPNPAVFLQTAGCSSERAAWTWLGSARCVYASLRHIAWLMCVLTHGVVYCIWKLAGDSHGSNVMCHSMVTWQWCHWCLEVVKCMVLLCVGAQPIVLMFSRPREGSATAHSYRCALAPSWCSCWLLSTGPCCNSRLNALNWPCNTCLHVT
jgi:hypothetical protein